MENYETDENPDYAQRVRQNQILLSWSLSSMTEPALSTVVHCKNSFEAWDALQKTFASHSKARALQLKMKLQTTKKNNLSMSDFVSTMKNLAASIFF